MASWKAWAWWPIFYAYVALSSHEGKAIPSCCANLKVAMQLVLQLVWQAHVHIPSMLYEPQQRCKDRQVQPPKLGQHRHLPQEIFFEYDILFNLGATRA